MDNRWFETARFAYITRLHVEGKQMHKLCKPKTLPTKEPRHKLQSTADGKENL